MASRVVYGQKAGRGLCSSNNKTSERSDEWMQLKLASLMAQSRFCLCRSSLAVDDVRAGDALGGVARVGYAEV